MSDAGEDGGVMDGASHRECVFYPAVFYPPGAFPIVKFLRLKWRYGRKRQDRRIDFLRHGVFLSSGTINRQLAIVMQSHWRFEYASEYI